VADEQIHLNAFTLGCVSPQFWGAWRMPTDKSARGFTELDYWIEFAQLLEGGLFDALFFADTMGVADVFGGDEAAALRNGVFTPAIDPIVLIGALAHATEHLGFAVTYSTSNAPPYQTARLFSSLDHITRGRIAWNIVTSTSKVNEANGMSPVVEHDRRYDIADEYLDVCYRLWEQSWAEDAMRFDRDGGLLVDPALVHRIDHHGEFFDVRGPHQVPPSPQRTPFLYQAGGSPRGTAFAGRHAEAVFLAQYSPERVRSQVDTIREQAAKNGRDPADVKILMGFRCLVGETDTEVARYKTDMESLASAEAALAMFGFWTGQDLGAVADNVRLADLETNDFASIPHNSALMQNDGDATVGDLKAAVAADGNAIRFVGTAEYIADEMELYMDCGLDGFNIVTGPMLDGFERFVQLVIPELQHRGRFRKSYEESVLRERYLGQGQTRLVATHPGGTLS